MHGRHGVLLWVLRPAKRTFTGGITSLAARARGFPQTAVVRRRSAERTTGFTLRQLFPNPFPRATCVTPERGFNTTLAAKSITPFLLADIGEGITECELVQWFVKPGEKVFEFDKICEVQSDKASVEITSRFEGVIKKIYYNVGEMAKVGKPLVDIETAGDRGAPSPSPDIVAPQPIVVVQSEVQHATPAGTVSAAEPPDVCGTVATMATPAVRRIARENGIDLKLVKGSGKRGRIMKEDVLNFCKLGSTTGFPAYETGFDGRQAASTVGSAAAQTKHLLTAHQKAMFKQMTKSLNIPHFGYSDEFELDALTKLRASLNARLQADSSGTLSTRYPHLSKTKKISYMPLFIKSLSLALNSFPLLNAQLVAEDLQNPAAAYLVFRPSHNVGVAMDTPGGLLVPNIKDVQGKSILEVADELARLQDAATRESLTPADLSSGTISLSNIGTIGGTNLNPVVVTTELCIAALGRMRRLPRLETVTLEGGGSEERVVVKQVVNVSWSADHRVVDGATLARFNELWRSYIEKPSLMLAELR